MADFWRDPRRAADCAQSLPGPAFALTTTGQPGEILFFFLSVKQRTISPISRLSNFTKFEHMKSIGFAMKICGTKNANVSRNFLPLATSGRHNSAIITDRRKFTTKITLYEISSFHFTVEINSKSFPWLVYSVQQTSPNLLRRPTQVDNTVDNADITQSQGSQSPSNLSHVTLGLVE